LNSDRLTEPSFWEDYWNKISLPLEIKRSKRHLFLNEILEVFDKYLPYDSGKSILEIGGAPGQYLAYMHRTFGYQIHSLDYSSKGCQKTEENFRLLGIRGMVYQQDLFSDQLGLPQFDIVYSLGFIEHFSDLNLVIRKHLDLLKQNGILLIGVPNLLGINKWFLQRLAPQFLAKHNLAAMDISNWKSFENAFRLKRLFCGYVGGFEPTVFKKLEVRSPMNWLLMFITKGLTLLFQSHFQFLRRYNSKWTSGYAIGVYRKP